MKIAVITPIPVEFNAAKEALRAKETAPCTGCRTAFVKRKDVECKVIRSGPGKTRAAQATTALIHQFSPDLVLDTGTCAGITPQSSIGDVILGKKCYEFDISGRGIAVKKMKEMELCSAFHFLPADAQESLIKTAIEIGKQAQVKVSPGILACGEFLIDSTALCQSLDQIFQATGSDWETAAVFVGALRAGLPAFSLRVTSDLGGRDALSEFRLNAKPSAAGLYQYLRLLIDEQWFSRFLNEWEKLKAFVHNKLPTFVLPA